MFSYFNENAQPTVRFSMKNCNFAAVFKGCATVSENFAAVFEKSAAESQNPAALSEHSAAIPDNPIPATHPTLPQHPCKKPKRHTPTTL